MRTSEVDAGNLDGHPGRCASMFLDHRPVRDQLLPEICGTSALPA
jgi:hypothetical protein